MKKRIIGLSMIWFLASLGLGCGDKEKKAMVIEFVGSFNVKALNVQPDCESASPSGEFSAKFYANVDEKSRLSDVNATSFDLEKASLLSQMDRASLRSGGSFPVNTSLVMKAFAGNRLCIFTSQVMEHDTFRNDKLSNNAACIKVPSLAENRSIKLAMRKGTCSLQTQIDFRIKEGDSNTNPNIPPPTPKQLQIAFGPSIEVKAENIDPDCEKLDIFDSDAQFSSTFYARLNNENLLLAALTRVSFTTTRNTHTLSTSAQMRGREGQQLCVNSSKTQEHDKIRNDTLSEDTKCMKMSLAQKKFTFELRMSKGSCTLSARIPVQLEEYIPPLSNEGEASDGGSATDTSPNEASVDEQNTCPGGGFPPCLEHEFLPFQKGCPPGNDLQEYKNIDLKTCQTKCKEDKNCKGLNYSVSQRRCFTKSADCPYPGTADNGYIYFKQFKKYPSDCVGNDIREAKSASNLNDCLAACVQFPPQSSRLIRFDSIVVGALNINPNCEKTSLNGEFSTTLSVTINGGSKRTLAKVTKVSLKNKETVPIKSSVTLQANNGQEICVLSSGTIEHDTINDDDLSEDKRCVVLNESMASHKFALSMRKGSCQLVVLATASIGKGPVVNCKGVSFSSAIGRCVLKSAICAFPGDAPGDYHFYTSE